MSVGEAARRVGMNEGELRSINTIPPRMLIKAGSVLVVPRAPSNQQDVASHVADNGQLSLAPEVTLRRTTVKAGRNESVASIARRYKVAPAQVAEWNNVGATAAFRAGQPVTIYLQSRAAVRGPVRAAARTHGPRAVAPRTSAAKPKQASKPVVKSKRR
jgi:membrane-bound lytic murein transglycosylase D